MANARKITETVVTTTGVTLELSVEEAHAIKFLVGKVGGISEFRSHVSSVYQALKSAGVDDRIYHLNTGFRTLDGSDVEFPSGLTIDEDSIF